jgi:hypothetical protein
VKGVLQQRGDVRDLLSAITVAPDQGGGPVQVMSAVSFLIVHHELVFYFLNQQFFLPSLWYHGGSSLSPAFCW